MRWLREARIKKLRSSECVIVNGSSPADEIVEKENGKRKTKIKGKGGEEGERKEGSQRNDSASAHYGNGTFPLSSLGRVRRGSAAAEAAG